MAIRITDKTMALEIRNRVVAAARFSGYAAADSDGAWIASAHPRLAVQPRPGDHGYDAR